MRLVAAPGRSVRCTCIKFNSITRNRAHRIIGHPLVSVLVATMQPYCTLECVSCVDSGELVIESAKVIHVQVQIALQ
jgi:hypothetical protein